MNLGDDAKILLRELVALVWRRVSSSAIDRAVKLGIHDVTSVVLLHDLEQAVIVLRFAMMEITSKQIDLVRSLSAFELRETIRQVEESGMFDVTRIEPTGDEPTTRPYLERK